jgi:ABC-2 type transport system permease protein
MTKPAAISPLRQFYWSILRELWEHRSIYVAPLAVAVLIVIAAPFHVPAGVTAVNRAIPHDQIEEPYVIAALLLMFTTILVAFYYCLEAFQSERRDRSILFWKSLPVSDLITVLSKASIPLFVLPFATFVVTAVTHVLMLLLGSIRLGMEGAGFATLWKAVPVLQMWSVLFYHLMAGHGIWYAPFYGWLLLVSAWARRAPLLWATLPLLALSLLERIAFNTSHFVSLLAYRFMGAPAGSTAMAHPMSLETLIPPTPMEFLNSPGFWFGLAFFTACLGAALYLRRQRGPI